jgi:hypothetical protein
MNTIWTRTLHVLETSNYRANLNDEQLTLLSIFLACYLLGHKPKTLYFNDYCDLVGVELREVNGEEKCVFTTKSSVECNALIDLSRDEVEELLTEINIYGKSIHPPIKTLDPKGEGVVRSGTLTQTKDGMWVVGIPDHREIAWDIAMIPSEQAPVYFGAIGTPSKGFQDPSWVYEFDKIQQAI